MPQGELDQQRRGVRALVRRLFGFGLGFGYPTLIARLRFRFRFRFQFQVQVFKALILNAGGAAVARVLFAI